MEKRRLYVTLPRPSNRTSYHSQNPVNMVSFHNIQSSGKKSTANGNIHEAAFVVSRGEQQNERTMEMGQGMLRDNRKESNESGCRETKRARKLENESFTCSQLTLTTSYEGNNNNNNNNYSYNKSQRYEVNRGGKDCLGRDCHDTADGAEDVTITKCTCWNCEKKKRGTSLTNRCVYQTIAKKIRFLPARGKLTKEVTNKNALQANKKFKLMKTLSSYTISNSSLQDLDESEFTSSELAYIMGQMKYGEVEV
ncbi:hypothetical protein RUM43_003703 [Polyplax serrata]|uniref:Uncharacterized protein n=1 Tax=Polyplax serrata TaxID=468196 RepID=A0AAN8PFX6_POLSC